LARPQFALICTDITALSHDGINARLAYTRYTFWSFSLVAIRSDPYQTSAVTTAHVRGKKLWHFPSRRSGGRAGNIGVSYFIPDNKLWDYAIVIFSSLCICLSVSLSLLLSVCVCVCVCMCRYDRLKCGKFVFRVENLLLTIQMVAQFTTKYIEKKSQLNKVNSELPKQIVTTSKSANNFLLSFMNQFTRWWKFKVQ